MRLEDADIIEKISGPTPCVSRMVVIPKMSGEVRIYVGMQKANEAVKREKHIMPTMDDIISDPNGVFVHRSSLRLSSVAAGGKKQIYYHV